ncbi:holliday junction resolvase [Microbacterium phage Cen1621]|uniref:Holliday junction resolvase n=1 Tax=Microbacterium phage Cen1621 TaxID=2965191 RepID=A0A9E7QB27_9CAUD|nr:holliday junction resolvase [Microbacterium phage Cen1621]
MANANKAKGTAWESAIVKLLNAAGIPARRVAQTGALDTGDIHGIDPFIGQAKNMLNLADALNQGLAGAKVQAARVNADALPVAFVKRRGKGTGDGYAVLDLATFARHLARHRELADFWARHH